MMLKKHSITTCSGFYTFAVMRNVLRYWDDARKRFPQKKREEKWSSWKWYWMLIKITSWWRHNFTLMFWCWWLQWEGREKNTNGGKSSWMQVLMITRSHQCWVLGPLLRSTPPEHEDLKLLVMLLLLCSVLWLCIYVWFAWFTFYEMEYIAICF